MADSPRLLTQKEIEELYPFSEKSVETLVIHNQGLIRLVAHKFYSRFLDFDDICQYGNEGLLKGIKKYDPAKGKFSTYVTWWIRQSISIGVYEASSPMHVPLYVTQALMTYKKTRKSDRVPLHILQTISTNPKSLEDFGKEEDDMSSDHFKFLSVDPVGFAGISSAQTLEALVTSVNKLPERNQIALKMFFGLEPYKQPYNYRQIGKAMNLSHERVRQIAKVSLVKLFKALSPLRQYLSYGGYEGY